MVRETPERARVVREYLLGALDESEHDEVEHALLADDALYEELVAAEDELLDDYVCGRLNAIEASALVGYLERLPDGGHRLLFAKGLQQASLRARKLRWVPTALAAAAAVVFALFGGSYVLREPGSHVTEPLSSRNLLGTIAEPRLPYVLLRPGIVRGAGERRSFAFAETEGVHEIRLDVAPSRHETYRAGIYDADRVERLVVNQLTVDVAEDRLLIRFPISTRSLPPGDYFIALSGLETSEGKWERLARYEFRVTRAPAPARD